MIVPTCERCGCRLAADNPGPRCSPCQAVARSAARSPRPPAVAVGVRDLVAAWDRGFTAFCDAGDLDHADGAELAVRLRLVPARSQLTPARVVALAEGRSIASSDLARRWGVSRRTVADWRRSLALERITTGASDDRAPELVVGVVVHAGPHTTIETVDGRIRLGRSARVLLDELVDHHPDVADDAYLRTALFADVDEHPAQAALHATVYRLRRHLPEDTIVREGAGYRLNVSASAIVRLDVDG